MTIRRIPLLLALLIIMTACTATPQDPPPGGEPVVTVEPAPAKELPPFITNTPTPRPELEPKATGYEYDYDSLTYELVWSDEFDYEGLPDPERWNYDVGGHGWGNNELQYYSDDANAFADGEKLTIEARTEQRGNREYTSARLVTRNKGDWLYGKIEVSAKLPSGLGTWPAIWMLPTDWEYGGWPDSGEIDIMEHVGYDQGRVHATVHTKAYNHMRGTQKGNGGRIIEDVSGTFNLYSIEWLPDRILFFINGDQVYEYDPNKLTSGVNFEHWPFDKRHHLLINIALGGDWGAARGFDPEMLPVTMEVDYVRVWQSPEISALPIPEHMIETGD